MTSRHSKCKSHLENYKCKPKAAAVFRGYISITARINLLKIRFESSVVEMELDFWTTAQIDKEHTKAQMGFFRHSTAIVTSCSRNWHGLPNIYEAVMSIIYFLFKNYPLCDWLSIASISERRCPSRKKIGFAQENGKLLMIQHMHCPDLHTAPFRTGTWTRC